MNATCFICKKETMARIAYQNDSHSWRAFVCDKCLDYFDGFSYIEDLTPHCFVCNFLPTRHILCAKHFEHMTGYKIEKFFVKNGRKVW
jgi:hypothetical protein